MATSREEPGKGGQQRRFVQVYQVLFSTQSCGMLETFMQTSSPRWLGCGG